MASLALSRCLPSPLLSALPAVAVLLAAPAAHAAVYYYVDWTAANPSQGTASGTISLPDGSSVTVGFAAFNADDSPGTLYGAQISGTTNYWAPSTSFTSEEVENPPTNTDILQLAGGLNQTYRVTLSEPIKDPVMVVVSLGSAGTYCTYDFDSPFRIVSQGSGPWGGSDTALATLAGDILQGREGNGTIQFLGTFSRFSWTVPTTETWHGFTFAIRTTPRLEPPAGGAGGVGGVGGAGGAGALAGAGGIGGVSGAAGNGGAAGAAGNGGAGGDATGGVAPGTGGVGTGGVVAGGAAGASTGGAMAGNGGVATGGVATGGVATGGVATGGVATGGVATGGVATGGVATGGVATGGVATGGVATGGVATGGVATGGADAGGAPGGSRSASDDDAGCGCAVPSRASGKYSVGALLLLLAAFARRARARARTVA